MVPAQAPILSYLWDLSATSSPNHFACSWHSDGQPTFYEQGRVVDDRSLILTEPERFGEGALRSSIGAARGLPNTISIPSDSAATSSARRTLPGPGLPAMFIAVTLVVNDVANQGSMRPR